MNPVYYFTFKKVSAFIPLKAFYPECVTLIEGESQLSPMGCFNRDCHRSANCPELLAKKSYYFFEEVDPAVEILFVYFKWHDKPGSIRAAVINRDLEEPKVITCNKTAFEKCKREGTVKSFMPTSAFLYTQTTPGLIPVETLIRS